MARRKIIIPIDSVLELFKSYTAETGDIPMDTKPVSLMIKPQERGMFAIVGESADWKHGEPPLSLKFDIRRVYTA